MFVVEMLRWGDRENHSYIIGVYDTVERAIEAGVAEEFWRGGKYEMYITEAKLNHYENDIEEIRTETGIEHFDKLVTQRMLDFLSHQAQQNGEYE